MAIRRFPVESSHILMFARAIGDPNPVYSDAKYAESADPETIIAPPTFVQAGAHFDAEYPLRPKIGEPWFGSGKEASGVTREGDGGYAGFLHAEQHFEYHRQLRPGDVLKAESKPGKTWEKEGRRSGTLSFSETITEYRDQHGELVVTARSVGVKTERPVERA